MTRHGTVVMTAAEYAAKNHLRDEEARARLEELAASGTVQREVLRTCAGNGHDLSGIPGSTCPECGSSAQETMLYVWPGQSPRLIPWFLVVHGMNTPGDWQEKLTWLIGRTYGRMLPVAIYKYGVIRPGVLFKWRQRQLMRKLQAKMKAFAAEAEAAQLEGRPDVIAHSFGTWLLAHALLADESIRIGRLILTGAVVPPDFPWQTLIKREQVEHILNHGATDDGWVRLAHLAIPRSGPGGTRGFPPPVTNVPANGFGHSDYFKPERLGEVFARVWRPFLSWDEPQFDEQTVDAAPWKPLPWLVRKTTWLIAVLAFLALLPVAVVLLGLAALLK